MSITATDFAISAGGAITQTGGSTVYSVLDLHAWLQGLAYNAAASGDDNVSILGDVPSELAGKRNSLRPAALTLLNGVNINQQVSQRFNFGSVEQLSGAELYTGVNTIGSGLAGRSHFVVQNNAKYNSGTKWWSAGPIRALFKVKASSALIAGNTVAGTAQAAGTITVLSREWGYSYSHFDVDCSAGSEQVAALSVSADSNITRLTGNYTGGTNTVTSTSPSFTVTITPGSVSRTLGGVTKTYMGILSWTGAVRLSEVYQALQWGCHESSTATLASEAGWKYRKLNTAYAEVQEAPFGKLLAGKWLVAQGWWIDTASLNSLDLQAYNLISHDGATVTPPNAISVSVSGLVATDYVLVGKDSGTGFNTTTGITSAGTASATTLTLSGAPASDVPLGAGFIRVANNAHTYTGISGVTVSGLNPPVPVGGYSGAATWFPYIDKATAATSESSTSFNWAADFTARVRVRNGSVGAPIVPFETTFPVSASGGSVSAIRNADQ